MGVSEFADVVGAPRRTGVANGGLITTLKSTGMDAPAESLTAALATIQYTRRIRGSTWPGKSGAT